MQAPATDIPVAVTRQGVVRQALPAVGPAGPAGATIGVVQRVAPPSGAAVPAGGPGPGRARVRGVTLIVVLLILIGVSILGVGGAHIALQSERSTRYDRDYQVAWQSAEAALMDAEAEILTGARAANFDKTRTGLFVPDCGGTEATRGLCEPSAGRPVWLTVDFLDDTAAARTVAFGTYTGRSRFDVGAGVRPAREPRYIIEWVRDRSAGMGAARDVMYRITAMGFGPREDVQVVLQSVFKKE